MSRIAVPAAKRIPSCSGASPRASKNAGMNGDETPNAAYISAYRAMKRRSALIGCSFACDPAGVPEARRASHVGRHPERPEDNRRAVVGRFLSLDDPCREETKIRASLRREFLEAVAPWASIGRLFGQTGGLSQKRQSPDRSRVPVGGARAPSAGRSRGGGSLWSVSVGHRALGLKQVVLMAPGLRWVTCGTRTAPLGRSPRHGGGFRVGTRLGT